MTEFDPGSHIEDLSPEHIDELVLMEIYQFVEESKLGQIPPQGDKEEKS